MYKVFPRAQIRTVPARASHTRANAAPSSRCDARRLLLLIILPLVGTPALAVDVLYSYDDLNRVRTMSYGVNTGDPRQEIVYDEVGNITSTTTTNSPDTDGDQIANFVDPDDDNDQMPDAWEIANGLDPLNAGDATSDADGDGISALDEYRNGTDPNISQAAIASGDIPLLPPWALGLFGALLASRLWRRERSA
jgi:hypothetical protein